MKKIVKTKCVNNKWLDFGSHTGFSEKERTCDNLIVGQWYELELDDLGLYELIEEQGIGSWTGKQINGYNIGTQFTINEKISTGERLGSFCRFSNFFLSIEEAKKELRDLKIKEILE